MPNCEKTEKRKICNKTVNENSKYCLSAYMVSWGEVATADCQRGENMTEEQIMWNLKIFFLL